MTTFKTKISQGLAAGHDSIALELYDFLSQFPYSFGIRTQKGLNLASPFIK
jgi:hypothetical protein